MSIKDQFLLFLDEATGTTHCWYEINQLLTHDLILSVSFYSVNQSLFLLLLP
jgi:hypothetical protein